MWKKDGRKKEGWKYYLKSMKILISWKRYNFFSCVYIFWILFTIIGKYRWSGLKYTLFERLIIN